MKTKRVISFNDFPVTEREYLKYSVILWKNSKKKIDLGFFDYSIECPPICDGKMDISYNSEIEYLLEGTTTERVELKVDNKQHRPLHLKCEFENIQQIITLDADYKKKKVAMSFRVDGYEDKWVSKIPFTVLDNYQMFMALRALDFEKMTQDTFSLVNCLNCSISEIEYSLIGSEIIETSLGKFNCYRICLQLYDPMPFTQYNFYAVDPPHHLIKVIKGSIVCDLSEVQ